MRALVVLLLIQSVWAQLFELFNPDTGSTTASKALRGNSTAVTSTAVPGVEGRVQARRLARTNRKGKKRSSQNFVDEEQGNGKGAVDEKKAQAAAAGAAVFVAATLGNDLLKLSMGMDIYGDPEESDDGIFDVPLYFLDTFHGLMTDAHLGAQFWVLGTVAQTVMDHFGVDLGNAEQEPVTELGMKVYVQAELRRLEEWIMGEVEELIADLVEDTSAEIEEGRLEDVAFEWKKIATDISKVGVLANSLSPDAAAGYLLSLERDMAHLPRKLFLPCIRSETGKRRFWGSAHCQQYINRPNVVTTLLSMMNLHITIFDGLRKAYHRQLQDHRDHLFHQDSAAAAWMVDRTLSANFRMIGCDAPLREPGIQTFRSKNSEAQLMTDMVAFCEVPTYYVLTHISDDNVQSESFSTEAEARARFNVLDNGAIAAMLVDGDFNELDFYANNRGPVLEDFREFWFKTFQACCVAPCQRSCQKQSHLQNPALPAVLSKYAEVMGEYEELFSHISHSFIYAQKGSAHAGHENHEKVLSAKKLLAPATGMFTQEEFWYFEGEDLANLATDGFRLSRSSGHGRLFVLLPAGATVPSPQINGVPLTSPYGTVYGDQTLPVPLMWDFKLSSQTLRVTGLNFPAHLQITSSYQPLLAWSSSQLEHSCTTEAAGYLKCKDKALKVKFPSGATKVDVTFFMRARCLGSRDCSDANPTCETTSDVRAQYQDECINHLPSSGTKVSWANEFFMLDDAWCVASNDADYDYLCDDVDSPPKFNIFTASFGAGDNRQNVVGADVWHKYHISIRGRKHMVYIDDKFQGGRWSRSAGHDGQILIDAAYNEIHVWGLTVSSKTPVIRVADIHHKDESSAKGRYFNFNADDLWIQEDQYENGQEQFDARVQQCQFDEAGDPFEDFTEFNDRELTVTIDGVDSNDVVAHKWTAHGKQKWNEGDGQFRRGDLLLMDPSLKCPACKDNLGVRAWNLPCGQLSHAIHVKDTQHVSGYVDMHFWFDNMPADLFGYKGESEIVGTVRQCRYNPTTGGPINGPFHNARVDVRVWTQVPHGRREHDPAEHQFLVDDFLLTDPSVTCPKCRWILNSLRVLHNRHDGYGSYQKGIIFSFDSGIAIPHEGHQRVRLCRFKNTAHPFHNTPRWVKIWNGHAAPGQRGPGNRHGLNLYGAGEGDWEVGDLLLLDDHVECPESEAQLSWEAQCP